MDTIVSWDKNREAVQVTNFLTNRKEIYTDLGDHFITGNVGNMYVKLNSEGLSLKGSLCKYLHGNSLMNMTRRDTQFAVEKLEDELQYLLRDSKISRLDFGHSLQLDQPPVNYLKLLDHLPRHQKLMQPFTTYFRNSLRTVAFYDKIREMKDKNQPIPQLFHGSNIMKAEVRYMHIGKQFKRGVTAHDLYDKDFFAQLQNEWKKHMMAIKKMKSLRPTVNNMTPDQYKDYIIASYVEEHGMDNVLKEIDRNKGRFTNRKNVQRVKEGIRKTMYLIESDPLITELENKLNNAFDVV